MKKCYLCGSTNFLVKNSKTRDNDKLRVLQCRDCSLTSLESFKHLKSIFYVKGDMHAEKISSRAEYNKFLKSLYSDDSRRFKQWARILKNKILLDFGCGAGGFLKLAKPIVKKAYGIELDNIKKFYNKEFEVREKIEDFKTKFDIITLFHVLEHIEDPIGLLKNLKARLNPGGRIIIEVPNDDDALISYYNLQSFKDFTYWSLHLYSYNKKSLGEICKRAGFKNVKINFCQRYSLANHIGWLKNSRPGGRQIYKELNNSELNKCYNKQLEKMGASDTLVAVLKV